MILHSIILGKGKPFVILHGFLGMADNWKTLGTQWSESGCEVHLLDQRNHGRSFHSDEHNYDVMAKDIKEYCEHHDLKNIILLGHSMGGKVAMRTAVLFPGLIDKLIIADIAPKPYDPHHSDIIHALESVDFTQINSRKDASETVGKTITDVGTRQFLLKSLYRKGKESYGWRFNLPVLSKAQSMVGDHTIIDKPIEIPTLFIRGGKSGYILDSDKAVIEHAFAKAELKTIPNAGHWLHAEQPDEFNRLVEKFVK
ncbi:Pimeloyl-ACP methyl ester carboxylesterase [Nonlabens sp. Hel1_33_55]|uniref:alpha/beta fold hydrolase n=1 Tax=Nonlabens sp. Hel1_33_55 TaxID=1336802 RepID=UPI000875EC68|nr:alpha/beta fold hydrolase [Nonlabens sp. Hel1_33_55]SCY37363.1 Pimeloyl-ACP methyl ester carboxylesterase [Nonlabens sp. Hel1_33_55]